jgi:hypothetical protein
MAAPSEEAVRTVEDEVPTEIVAAIAAAVAVFLGKRFHIRSLELLHPELDSASRWMRQGRTFVQASHNLRTKR